jgi:hypothetical protein
MNDMCHYVDHLYIFEESHNNTDFYVKHVAHLRGQCT